MKSAGQTQASLMWRGLGLATGAVVLLLAVAWAFDRLSGAKRELVDDAKTEIRGSPIEAGLPATNEAKVFTNALTGSPASNGEVLANNKSVATNAPAPSPRRKRPKPGSYPQRLVQSLLAGKGTDTVDYAESPGLVKLRVGPLPPMPDLPGYRVLRFPELSNFNFALVPELADSRTNAAATSLVLEQIPEAIRRLDGAKIALQGFLVPLRMDEGLAVEFLLLRDQSLCCFGRLPQVHEWVLVRAAGHGVKPKMDEPITVAGTLHVGDQREEGIFTGIYKLDAERIVGP